VKPPKGGFFVPEICPAAMVFLLASDW
jgi:hypothetical protein